MPGYSPKDTDYVTYQEHPLKFKFLRQITKPGVDLFIYNKDLTFEEHVKYLIAENSKAPQQDLQPKDREQIYREKNSEKN